LRISSQLFEVVQYRFIKTLGPTDIKRLIEVINLFFQERLINKSILVDIVIRGLVSDDIDEIFSECRLKLLFQDNIIFRSVGENQFIALNPFFAGQPPQNSNKGGYAGAAGQEYTGTLILNRAPGIPANQSIAHVQRIQLSRHSLVLVINLDGKFQVRLLKETGKSKGALFFSPVGFVNGHFRSLPRYKFEIVGLVYLELFYIVGDGLNTSNG